jgi:Flp pilus assembly pilin Flp
LLEAWATKRQADKKILRSPRNQLTNSKLHLKFQGLKNGKAGQGLVEFALLVALIALHCISGASKVTTAVNGVFSNISSSLA